MGRAISAFKGPETGLFPPRQERVALALAAGRSLREAASECRTGETTGKRWLADQAFVRRIGQLRAEMTGQAVGRLVDGMVSAADTLGYLCRKGKSEMVRLGAARALLELGVKLRETVEFEERISALEGREGPRRIA
jgi:hypothetical protein